MKEHFFIVGGQRCGTSFLYNMLDDHPEISMAKPMLPEPKYFLNTDPLTCSSVEYLRILFSHCDQGKAKVYGEKSTSYYEVDGVAERIAKVFPLAKIIFLLRNPVARAISNYFFTCEHGLETRSIDDAFLNDEPAPNLIGQRISVDPFNYLGRGLYNNYIQNYLLHFPRKNIKIIISEALFQDLDEIQDLYDFLGVERTYMPSGLKTKVNSSLNAGSHIYSPLRSSLSKYYESHNQELARSFDLDLSMWS